MGPPAPYPCPEPNCDREFSTAQALGRHRSAQHGTPGASKKTSARKKSEDEVITVLDVLVPKGVKAEHVELVGAWIAATREMLATVRA